MRKISFFIVIILLAFMFSCDDEPNRNPTVTISADVTFGKCPLTVNFTADATDPDGDSLTFAWDFGDGSGTSTEQNPTYVYNSVGVFTAGCTVTDNGSPQKSATAMLQITAEANIPELRSLSPSWKVTHMPTFTLTLTGSNFIKESKVYFDGTEKSPTFISSYTLEVQILPDDTLVDSYTYKGDAVSSTAVQVYVTNPETGGGDSGLLDFQIYSNHRFTEPEQVIDESDRSAGQTVKIRTAEDRIYIGWIGEDSPMFKYSENEGDTWSSDISIPYASSAPFSSFLPSDDSGTLYGLLKSDYYTVAFSKSINTGSTWSDPYNIFSQTELDPDYDYTIYNSFIFRTPGGTICSMARVMLYNEDGFFGFTNYLMRSTDEGVNWSNPEKVFYYPTQGSSNPQSISYDKNGRVFVFFSFGSNYPYDFFRYYLSYSDDNGVTWSDAQLLSMMEGHSYTATFSIFPNTDLTMLINEVSSGTTTLTLYRKSQGAASWSKLSVPRTFTGYLYWPSVAIDSAGNINLVYWTKTNNDTVYRVYYMRSIDGGWTWAAPIQLTAVNTKSSSESIAIDDEGNLYIVYQGDSKPYEGYFLKSTR